jgi:hypothetical protein
MNSLILNKILNYKHYLEEDIKNCLRKTLIINIEFKDGSIKSTQYNKYSDSFEGHINRYVKKNCFVVPFFKSEYKIVQ